MSPQVERSTPAYVQVAAHIRDQIVSGELAPGDVVSSVREPAATWRIARATAENGLRQGTTRYVEEVTGRKASRSQEQISARPASMEEAQELMLPLPLAAAPRRAGKLAIRHGTSKRSLDLRSWISEVWPHDGLQPPRRTGKLMNLPLMHSGKVRDVYADGDDIILVASDRVSVYDVVLPTPIPDKGKILTKLSLWWFDQLKDLTPNHVLSTDGLPPEWADRAVRCRRLEMIQVECIARGYLAGLGLREYEAGQAISAIPLPSGLVEGSRLPAPIFTPTTKAPPGDGVHDEFITFDDVVADLGNELAEHLRDLTLRIYNRGALLAADRGVIIADTKLEFGWSTDRALVLGDEILTSDSSRFWPADQWQPGGSQFAMDKQFIRDWAARTGWNKKPPAPEVPEEIVETTRARYIDVYERITGTSW